MLENEKEITLLSRNKSAKKSTIIVWKPQRGDKPIKTPNAIDKAFFFDESWCLIKSSTIKRLNPFFFEFTK